MQERKDKNASRSRNVLHVCRTLLAREHKRIRAEYEERVKQLEQERQGVEEERVQVQSKLEACSGFVRHIMHASICAPLHCNAL